MLRFETMFITTQLFVCLMFPTFLCAAMKNEHRITISKAFYDRKSIASLCVLSKVLPERDIRIKIMHDYTQLGDKKQICENTSEGLGYKVKELFPFADLMALDRCYFEGINLLNTIYLNSCRRRVGDYDSRFNEKEYQKICNLPRSLRNKFKFDGIASFDLYIDGVLNRIDLNADWVPGFGWEYPAVKSSL